MYDYVFYQIEPCPKCRANFWKRDLLPRRRSGRVPAEAPEASEASEASEKPEAPETLEARESLDVLESLDALDDLDGLERFACALCGTDLYILPSKKELDS